MNNFNPQNTQQPSANTAAVATLAAPTNGERWTLPWVSWNYSATPTGGGLTIVWTDPVSSTTYTETYTISAAGPGMMTWNPSRRFSTNTQVVVSLLAGSGSVVGQVFTGAFTER